MSFQKNFKVINGSNLACDGMNGQRTQVIIQRLGSGGDYFGIFVSFTGFMMVINRRIHFGKLNGKKERKENKETTL